MANTYTLISSVTVGAGGASSIDFTSIPATYTDLLMVVSGRSSRSGTVDDCKIQFNNSTTGYSDRWLNGNGASATSGSESSSGIYDIILPASSATSNTFCNALIYIPNYAGSNYKSVSIDGVMENNATTAYADLRAGLWSNTAAITSIKLTPDTGPFAQYSTAYLYGIKNS